MLLNNTQLTTTAKDKKKKYNEEVKRRKLERAFCDFLSNLPAGVVYSPQ